MPRTFTFGAGNARKLLRIPLYALGAAASLVVPRTRALWVAGSGIGLGEGAVPLVRLASEAAGTLAGGGTRRIVWLAIDREELLAARAAGFDAEPKHGPRGFWLTLRARVLIVTHGLGDVNRYAVRGGFVVQLWHGIPLKRLHLDTPAALRVSFLPDHPLVRRLMARAYGVAGRGISLFPVASALVAARITSAFGVAPERVLVAGDIRDDVLLRDDPDTRRDRARAVLEAAVGPLGAGEVILYAPTWRDGAPDPGAPTPGEWADIRAWLERRDATLLVRSHPLGLGDYAAGADDGRGDASRVRLLGSDRVLDVTPVLSAVDTLVTDYSSIAFDHALTGGRAVFLAPDLETYAKSRGLYQSYREFCGGRRETTWSGVLDRLDEPADRTAAHTAWLAGEHIDRLDGHAAERVLAEVLRRTGEPVPALPGLDAPAVHRPVVRDLGFEPGDGSPALRVAVDGLPPGASLRLEGARATVAGLPDADGSVRLPLLREAWGWRGLALPSGDYRLIVAAPDAQPSARLEVSAAPLVLEHADFRAEVRAHAGGLQVRVAPPLADDERGPAAQRALEDAYHRAIVAPQDAVFFESFFGRSVACNPLAIDRALAAARPDVVRYWSTIDASVPVPEGAVRIIEGSREWWHARAAARMLVVNDWLRKRWRRRRHQRVLQTWHGTMLKRLALDRAGRSLRTRIAVLRERDRWDLMLAQNGYAAQIFRSAYAFRGDIWQLGYPRNDVLAADDPTERDAVRARIGVPHDAKVVLYAPTWRDDRTEMVDYLDAAAFADELPDRTVLLVRGHSRTLPFGETLHGDRLIDVTTYPNATDLLLAADVLVTDYSSVMFDFAATDRPIVLFAPDLEHYSEDLRGFYFDLLAESPGPIVADRDALLEVLRDPEAAFTPFAERRVAWRSRFAPDDDGRAAERVVQRMLDEGLLG